VRYVVGIDLGGTNIVAGTVSEDGSDLVGVVSEPTFADQGTDAVIARIAKLARASMAKAKAQGKEIAGVGIGSPGPLDTKTGIVLITPNLGWTNVPLRDRVARELGLPAALDNDANCAIYGEWWRGAARGKHHVVGLTIGTGIGGGIVLGGEVYRGASDIAAEFGHITIDLFGRRCKCGNDGCLEAYASGPAIAARAIEGIRPGTHTSLPEYVRGDLAKITAQVVYEAAHDGDEYAREVVKDTAKFLGAGVASIINIFNPEVVVICGGVTLAGERLFDPLRAEVERRAFKAAVDVCRIVPGELTGTAGVYGAAAVFIKHTWGRI
jgi:glucokinase